MKFIGVDLHKQTITVCVMGKVDQKRKVLERKRFRCSEPGKIREFFEQVARFKSSWRRPPVTNGFCCWLRT